MIKRLSLLSFLLFSLISYQGYAAEDGEETENGETEQEVFVTDNFNAKGEESDPLERLIEIPEFKARYDSCLEAKSDNLGECIWNGDGKNIASLTDEQKKTAQDFMQTSQANATDGRQPAGSGSETDKKYESVNISRFQSGKKDKALIKIEAFFADKLKTALYGDLKDAANKKQVQVVDHAVFYDLFENRISKNIVEATSSFCIEAVRFTAADVSEYTLKKGSTTERKDSPSPIFMFIIDKSKIDQVRKDSIANLKLKSELTDSTKSNTAYDNWTQCIASLDYMCHGFTYGCTTQSCPKKVKIPSDSNDPNVPNPKLGCGSKTSAKTDNTPEGVTCSAKNLEYSRGRACAVTNYLKNARQSLLAVTSVKERWQKLAEESPGSALIETSACKSKSRDAKTGKCTQTLDVKLVSKSRKDGINPEIDKMNTLTSQELVDASGFKEEASAISDEYKKCDEGDDEICKKFIAQDKKEKLKELAEMSVRSNAMLGKLDSDEFNKDEIEKYLKEQGYTDKQIGDNLQDQAKLDAIKKEIIDKYAEEREQLVANLKQQIEDTTIEGEFNREDNDNVIKAIGKNIEKRTERFGQLVHFNNIVSGYLEVTDESGAKTRNTASLYAEINDSSKDVVNEADIEIIRSVAQDAGVVESDDEPEGGSPTLKVDELNSQILDYGTLDQ
jgi:hypothetical protein